ncbi:peptidase s45 penicillin amidase [Anaeramoeba flamelloides]|uniref:Peptidase s45 penicillin amidase n=1 Tax=Anaeramoeba flamelloides TaxID=1746091 RepID=A0ABQ8XJI5_9EUKA|nr:peptidase s45 penicillin amidase [Anaeramoeba flamelloides]
MKILVFAFLIPVVYLIYKYRNQLLAYYFGYLSKKAVPNYSGTIYVEDSLRGTVDISRDKYGVPHISAKNETDLYFGMGYCQAQDRLFQMDVARRVVSGRMSGMMGKAEAVLSSDIFFRTLGLNKLAIQDYENCTKEEKKFLQSFAAGINSCIEEQKKNKKVPVEFKLVKTDPEPWEPKDTFLVFRLLGMQMNFGFITDVIRKEMISQFGEDPFNELQWIKGFPKSKLFEGTDFDFDELCKNFNFGNSSLMSLGYTGSNCFAVSGEHTSTGKPMVVSDPHLAASNPSPLYLAHLKLEKEQDKENEEENEEEDEEEKEEKEEEKEKEKEKEEGLNIIGSTVPGLPTIIIGRNQKVAWGITLTHAKCENIFAEKVKGKQYFYDNKWVDGEIFQEQIEIKGEKNPHTINIMVTHHGPILYYDPLKSDQKEEEQIKLSYWSNSIEPSKPNRNMFSAIRGLTKSKNVHESRQSLKDVESVSVNLVLADVEGNIAHQITGKFPVKTENHQKHPIFPGWLPEFDFQKYIPFEEFPHYINPECGYLVSSNNMHKGEWPFFGKNYLLPTRYERITEIIEEMIKTNTENNTKINSKDFFGIIWDVKSMSGDRFVNILEKKFDGFLSSHENKQIPIMWQKLKSWDRMMEKDSVGASLYETLRVQLIRSIILSKLDQNLKILFSGKTFNSIIKDHSAWTFSHYQILNDLLENHENSWWIKEQKNDIETILGNGFVETLQFWEKKKGLTISQIDQWTYGKIHKFELQHMFSQVIEAAKMAFNSEAVEYGGNSETVCLQSSCETWLAQSYMCSSMRAFFDLNDPKNTEYILSSGNSSNSASEFNLNHFNITLQKSSATAYWEKVDYLKNEKHHLQLIPKNKTKIETKKEK